MAQTIKATCREGRSSSKSGKAFNPNHNTMEATRKGQPHINEEFMELNEYVMITETEAKSFHGGAGGFNSTKHERERQQELFGDGLNARNARYSFEGHSERCRTISQLINDPKTAPMEFLFQIGDRDTDMPAAERAEKLKKAFLDFLKDVLKDEQQREAQRVTEGMCAYRNLIPLDYALHMDETTPHIHFRACLAAPDKYGLLMPNQNRALEEMGYERPDINKPKSRYNNPLISFSDDMRERFYKCCEKQGLTIDREVINPSRRQEEIHLFKFKKMQEDISRLEMELKENEKRTEMVLKVYQETNQNLNLTQSQLSDIKIDLEKIEESRKELEKEVFKLTAKKNDAQIDVHNLKVTLEKLQAAIEAAQQRYQELHEQTGAEVKKLAALEQHARAEYDAYDSRAIKKYDTIEAQPEKTNIFGKVTQEATPRMYLVDADQLDRAERALGHVWINDYNNKSIKDLEKKLTESEAVQELRAELQKKDREIDRLTGINEKQARDIRKKDAEIGNRDTYLLTIGKKQEFEAAVKQSQHRGIHR